MTINNNSNLPQNSTPPRASFASALAQKPATAASKSESPIKASAAVAAPTPDQSPVVKLPSNNQGTSTTPVAAAAAKTPVITIDGSKAAAQPANPIKFGSFAAAAASTSQNEQVSTTPALPPRTQSAPPNVVEQQKQQQKQPAIIPVKEGVVDNEHAVVLPAIQEDSHSQQQPQVSFNYEGNQQQRPPRYHNPNNLQRYYNPQHQQQQPYYQQNPQYHHNPNYRPHQNYRPRPQYHQGQGGYYPPAMPQGYYPPPQGYYRPPQQENMTAPSAAPFQRPAPTFNNFVAPSVAPVVPANMPAFATTIPVVVATAPVSDVVVAPAAAPAIVKPAPAKIKIVDPNTGKELNFGSKSSAPATSVEEVKKEEVRHEESKKEETIKKEEALKPVTADVAESVKAATVSAPVATPVAVPVKKISIVIKDPNSHKELDLSQVVSRPVVKEDLAVEELTAAFSESTKLDDLVSPRTPLPCESPVPTAFQHDKEILAKLNVDDDELGSDFEDDDDDYSDYSDDEEEEEEVFIPSTVQYNQSISYPESVIPFKPPTDETGVWLYSREFMLQFREKCTTTPGDLQERLSAAVKKAKEFASSDRLHASDRPHRRDHREDRKKRRNHNGAVGPQAHLLDMNAVLKNRAENAWAPVRSAEELSQVERILREVKGLLNKLTLEKFHVISDKILALGIMSPDVLSGVIDCVFDKSVSEPRFAPMYAELCYKIVVEELNGLKKTLSANVAPDSQFRRLLVERCQAEYKHKRAWSKKRLEKLLETSATEETSEEGSAAPETSESDAPKANVGELTEEDYMLIKLKRRVLGNMRFIGEIFKVGLIGEKIMHSIITELLSNVENPEEEEIECLCRLLMTVGAILDKPEAANFWNQYVGRMNWLISQSGKLSSRVRFMVMDTLELREKKWKTGKAEEGPKTIAQIQKEQQNKERSEREKEREYRDQRDRERGGDRDRGNRQANAPAIKFSSKQSKAAAAAASAADEWNRTGPSKSSSLNRGPSVRRAPTPSQPSPVENVSSVPVSPSAGRFDVLNIEDESEKHMIESEKESDESNIVAESVDDEERVKKIVSLLDELIQMNNFADVYEEIKVCGKKSSALSGLLNRAIESGKKPALSVVVRIFKECPDLSRSCQLEAAKQSFGMIDDLAVDVPSIYEIAGQLFSSLNLSLNEIFETLSDCSDDSAKTRVILQTIAQSNETESLTLKMEAKDFVEKNKKPAIENLIKKLNIEI